MGIRAQQRNGMGSPESHDSWLDLKSLLVTLGCLFGATYSSYLLYQNIESLGARSGAPVAKLERVEAKVRLKPVSSFVWGNVKANEDLYLKDSIQTAPKGGATVKFNDGTVLEVGENSLIIIDTIENLSLGFLRGSAVLRTRNGDSRITMDKDGKTHIEALPVRLVQPEALSHYFAEGAQSVPIQFTWELKPRQGQALPAGLSIQVSSSQDFRADLREVQVAQGKSEAMMSLPAGDYYWRVLSQHQPLGEAAQFTVDSVSGLKPLFPEASDKVPVFTQGGHPSVQFRWVPQDDADDGDYEVTHRIEIASDPSFRNILHTQAIAASTGSSIVSDEHSFAGSGERYWRLVSRYEGSRSRLTVRSAGEKFEVERIASISIQPSSPADGEMVRADKIRFAWQSDVDSVGYRLEVQGASGPKSLDAGAAKTYSWNDARAGRYQWRVQAVFQDRVVGQSAWKSFVATSGVPIGLRSPDDGKAIQYWTDPPRFEFAWNADPKAQGYLVEVASDATFKDASSARTTGTRLQSQQIGLKSGPQFWRVSALDAQGQMINSSATRRLTYGVYPLLRAPASAKPEPGSVINPLQMNQDPAITWSQVPDAQGYEVTIKEGSQVVTQQVVHGFSYSMKNIKAGKYAYSIRAIDKLQRKGEALGDRPFEITYGQPLAAPEALSPEVQ